MKFIQLHNTISWNITNILLFTFTCIPISLRIWVLALIREFRHSIGVPGKSCCVRFSQMTIMSFGGKLTTNAVSGASHLRDTNLFNRRCNFICLTNLKIQKTMIKFSYLLLKFVKQWNRLISELSNFVTFEKINSTSNSNRKCFKTTFTYEMILRWIRSYSIFSINKEKKYQGLCLVWRIKSIFKETFSPYYHHAII